ncbi:MAG: hypothetical protein KF865_06510 [Bdellovibrionaceae bacterium]|nr:hypothetical protein [Pseudobdellovibrionaceae bacterium]
MEVACYRIKLKPNSIPLVREWAARLNGEMSEVKKLLSDEGMALESVFLEKGSDGDFLIYYLRSPDLKKTREVSQASQHPIDIYHRQVMKQIAESHAELECLLDATGD